MVNDKQVQIYGSILGFGSVDEGTPRAVFAIEEVVYNMDVQMYVRVKEQ